MASSLRLLPTQLEQSAVALEIAQALRKLDVASDLNQCLWHGVPLQERARLLSIGHEMVTSYLHEATHAQQGER